MRNPYESTLGRYPSEPQPTRTMHKPIIAAVVAGLLFISFLLFFEIEGVDSTDHCVETRYGNVVNEKMDPGMNILFLSKPTCFKMTEQNYPAEGAEEVEAQTSDPITVKGDVAVVWAYDPSTVVQVFKDKRSESAVEVEVRNAIREGYRSALASWSVAEIFSTQRASLSDSVKVHVQRKLGNRAQVKNVFVRDISVPPQIEQARIAAAQQAQILDKAEKDKAIANANAEAAIARARGEAESKRMLAGAYASNPVLAQLEIAREMAKVCSGAQTCVLGGSIVDTWRKP